MKETIENMIVQLGLDGVGVIDLGCGKFEVISIHPRVPQQIVDYLDANYHVIGKEDKRVVII